MDPHTGEADMAPAPVATSASAKMSVRGAAIWAMSGQYLSFAIQFIASVVISRFFLTPGEVGLFSIALAAALVVSVLQDFGLSRYIAGRPMLDSDEIARCSSVAIVLALAVAAVVALAAWPMAATYHDMRLVPIVLTIAASYLFTPLSVVPMALMARDMQFRGHFTVNVAGAVAQGAVAVAMAAAGASALALALSTIAAAATRGLVAQMLRPAFPRRLRLDAIGQVLGFGARSTTLYLTGALGTRLPDLIVGKALGMIAVGLFGRATSLADQFRMLISGAIGSVFFPAFAKIRDRGEPLAPAYLRVCAAYSAVLWPGMGALALAATPIVRLLYGPAWAGVAPLLSLIALLEVFVVTLPLHIDLPILVGKIDRLMARNIIDTLLSLGLLAIGCQWGVTGAAASRLVYGACWIALYAGFMRDVVGFSPRALMAIYARSALVALATLAPLMATYIWIASPQSISLIQLAAASLAGGVMWVIALQAVRHPARDEFFGLARDVAAPVLRRFSPRAG
jgi:O-antigen/teichoic acid export membrane protein